MNQQTTLYTYACTVPAAISVTAGWKAAGILFQEHLPLLDVLIDFETGRFSLKGCRTYINSGVKQKEAGSLNGYADWVVIDAQMDCTSPVQLNRLSPAGLVIAVEGNITKNGLTSCCTGVMLLSKPGSKNKAHRNDWRITGYLYDVWLGESEVKFNLPMFTNETEEKFYQSYMFN